MKQFCSNCGRLLKSGTCQVCKTQLAHTVENFCSKCGATLSNRLSGFCIECGEPLSSAGQQQAVKAKVDGRPGPQVPITYRGKNNEGLVQADNARKDPKTLTIPWLDLAARVKNLRSGVLSDTADQPAVADANWRLTSRFSVLKTCRRCNSPFEARNRTASRVICPKCVKELDIAAKAANFPIRICEQCKGQFKPNTENQRFCSHSCSAKARSGARSKREELVQPAPGLQQGLQAEADNTKNRAELNTKERSDSTKNLAKVIEDRINDVFKRLATPQHESEVTAERVQILKNETPKTMPSIPSPSEPHVVANVTQLPTSITLAASNTNPVIHEPVTFTVTLTAGNMPLSRSVTIWHTSNGIRYNDITMETPCTFTKNWRFAAVRHYFVTFAGDAIYAESTSAELDINVGAHAATETAAMLEASGKHPSISKSDAELPTPSTESLVVDESSKVAHYSLKTCLRCNSVFKSYEQAANEVLCIKCLSELSAAATDKILGVRTCLYCGKKFKPDDVSSLTGFCSTSCSAKAFSEASTELHKIVPPKSAVCEEPDEVNVEKGAPAELVGSSAQRVWLSEEDNWNFETFLSTRVAQYDGQYTEIAAFAVPFYKLLCDLLNEELIDWHAKIMISSALGYLVLADDVIPDYAESGLRLIDDVYVMAHVLQSLLDHCSEEITRNWHSETDIFAVIDLTHNSCHELVQSQSFEILEKVGLYKFQDLELEEYSGSYQERLAKVALEKRELLGLLAYIMRQIGFKKVDRSSVKKIRSQIEHSGNAAEINRIIELAKKDHDIKIEDKEFEDWKEKYLREMNKTMWK